MDSEHMQCPVHNAIHIVGKKWTIDVLNEIKKGKFKGFNRFVEKTKITPRMLSRQLKELGETGLIRKNKIEANYTLTEKGKEFCQLTDEIKKWNIKWNNLPEICLETTCSECKNFSYH